MLVLPAAANASFQARILDRNQVNLTGSDDAEAHRRPRRPGPPHAQPDARPASRLALDFDTAPPGVQSVTGSPIASSSTARAATTRSADRDVRRARCGRRRRGRRHDRRGRRAATSSRAAPGDDFADGGAGARPDLPRQRRRLLRVEAEQQQRPPRRRRRRRLASKSRARPGADQVEVSGARRGTPRLRRPAACGSRRSKALGMSLFDGDDADQPPMPPDAPVRDRRRLRRRQPHGWPDRDEIYGGPAARPGAGRRRRRLLFGEACRRRRQRSHDGRDVRPRPAVAEGEGGYDITHMIAAASADPMSLARQERVRRDHGHRRAVAVSARRQRGDRARHPPRRRLRHGRARRRHRRARSPSTLAPATTSLRGSDGIEWLSGGSAGDHVLDGGVAPDHLSGRRRRRRDPRARPSGRRDRLRGRHDVVIADLADLDPLVDPAACEAIERAAPTGPVALARLAAGRRPRLGSDERVLVPVACSAGARSGCQGTVDARDGPDPDERHSAPAVVGRAESRSRPGTTGEVDGPCLDGEDLARAAGTRGAGEGAGPDRARGAHRPRCSNILQ